MSVRELEWYVSRWTVENVVAVGLPVIFESGSMTVFTPSRHHFDTQVSNRPTRPSPVRWHGGTTERSGKLY